MVPVTPLADTSNKGLVIQACILCRGDDAPHVGLGVVDEKIGVPPGILGGTMIEEESTSLICRSKSNVW